MELSAAPRRITHLSRMDDTETSGGKSLALEIHADGAFDCDVIVIGGGHAGCKACVRPQGRADDSAR